MKRIAGSKKSKFFAALLFVPGEGYDGTEQRIHISHG